MPLTPVEIRHLEMRRGFFGYKRALVHRVMDEIADSFEAVWRERADLVERVETLETELNRHAELEALLRSTLVSAERAALDLKEHARREAEVIMTEANAEARRVLRDAITEKEQLYVEVQRIRALLRSALSVVDEVEPPAEGEEGVETAAASAESTGEPSEPPSPPESTPPDTETTDPGWRRLAG
jgi:cell division initiation protein